MISTIECPKVFIVLVNWNGWRDTIECIKSLLQLDYQNFEIVVIDNNSSDESVVLMRAEYPKLNIIELKNNTGFAGGNNIGIRYAFTRGSEYVWLLNNDTTVTPNALSSLVSLAESNPDFHFFGSWISFFNDKQKLWYGGGTYNGLLGKIGNPHFGKQSAEVDITSQTSQVQWVTGCSLLISKKTIDIHGYMDETLFLYREELEWQLRKALHSPRALILNTPLVFHKVGESTGSTDSFLGTLFMSRNYLRIAFKYMPLTLGWLFTWSLEYLIKPAIRGKFRALKAAFYSILFLEMPGDKIVERYVQVKK